MSMAIVIGADPAGDGRVSAAMWGGGFEVNIANAPRMVSCVDDHRAVFDPVGLDEFRFPHRADNDVGLPHHIRKIDRARNGIW